MQRIASIDKVSPRVAARTHVAALSLAVTAALLIAGCAEAPKPGPTGLYAQQARITDEAIRSDLAVLQALQGRLDKVKAKSAYHGAKAATWLDFARDEYHENDRTGVIEAATAEAAQLIDALEKGASPGMDTPLVAGSVKLREDLWAKAAQLKAHPQFPCAAAKVAEMEVELVWAGHEEMEQGSAHARGHVERAEALAREAEADLQRCAPPPPPPPPVAPPPQPVVEKVTLAADALFKFNRSELQDMLPEGRAKLDLLVANLKGMKQIEAIRITGHADRFGTPEYNLRLSTARAATVAEYLSSQGLAGVRMTTEGVGATQPSVSCVGGKDAKTIACLAPNRRVELEIKGLK